VHSVLNVLHSFVDKSNIDQQLEVFNATAGMLLLISPLTYSKVTDVVLWPSLVHFIAPLMPFLEK